MTILQQLQDEYDKKDCRDLGARQLQLLRDRLKKVQLNEIKSAENGRKYIELLKKFREAVAENDKLHGENYPQLLNSLLSVGEDGLYSNSLRFIFELIQNVDDCDYSNPSDCKLDMQFDFENNKIILTYNETGFTPFNVFAITGIAEAAKNVSSEKNQIGEKGIGFKSVFGVANKVQIKSGWFSFELHKENFTIPVPVYSDNHTYHNGTQMILYVPRKVKQIYKEIKEQYCRKEALFSRNPLLFLNKLTSLKFYFDSFRSMEFRVSRTGNKSSMQFDVEKEVKISVQLHDYENGSDINEENEISCTRYTYSVVFSKQACKARYGEKTQVGQENGKTMILSAVIPNSDFISEVGNGALYSFLPTQLKLTVPIVCHVPFKLDASREFVDPQENNLWFQEASRFLAEMMDKIYLDYCHTVKADIIRYLPNKESFFAVNNGKEKCLTEQNHFQRIHYLELPIFYTVDNTFKKSGEIFCFSESENIEEPEKVYKLMEYQRSLFIPPIPVNGFSIRIEKNVKDNMLKKALKSVDKTADILEYLNSVNYSYSEEILSEIEPIKITQSQLQIILKCKKLVKLLQKICCDAIKYNKRFRLEVIDASEKLITDILKSEFNMSDVPVQIRDYLKYCHEKCICINTSDNFFLPCHNAVILSINNPLTSFASFCYAIDENDTFAIRIKIRDASKELNKYVEDSTISDNEYMRRLRQIRKIVKDSLGNEGYKSYLEIILKAGMNPNRFIQEILQNADDCFYAQDVTPNFSLSVKGSTIVTEYNETGFTRANIRSITAIGESTKKKIIGKTESIGEKGVGFKTIFAIASKVTIHSGKYHFSLSKEEPTIPTVIDNTDAETVSGTKMEITLKNDIKELPLLQKEKEVLELCLCLRKLKQLKIGKFRIEIKDTENSRTITIGKNKYVFKRFWHNFTIENPKALEERKNGNRKISAEQQIVCYVPESSQSDFLLYCGLPTSHKIKIPMAIDAPFSLTTSRETIETEGSEWNGIIRQEMYTAIMKVIDSLKVVEKSKVFRFIRFVPRFQGIRRSYVNETFENNKYLNDFDFLSQLQKHELLPTYDKDVFAVPSLKNAFRFPDCCIYIFDKISLSDHEGINVSSIIKIKNDEFDSALNALGCKEADFSVVFNILSQYAEKFIKDENFRDALYKYFADAPSEYKTKIKELQIIPVYETHSIATTYIAWEENSIFVKPNEKRSGEDYYVLNEEQMPKSSCEKIFGVNINEMDSDYERTRYNKRLKERIYSNEDSTSLYKFLISEYRSGKLQKNESFDILSANRIPLKNQRDEITRSNLFICEESGYFNTKMIMRITVHDECRELAKAIRIKELKNIHYEDIDYNEELTADDIEMLIDEPDHYFVNYAEILGAFYRDGLLSDELLQEYSLDYFAYDSYDVDNDYEFPTQTVDDRIALMLHIKKLWSNPEKIITVEEMCKVKKIKVNNKLYSYDRNYSRNIMLNRYSPEGKKNLCFCQMCHKVKPKPLIEVNNIELLPEYFFSELRIALCLECSKKFEALRNNDSIREAFLKHIKEYDIHVEESKVEIPIGNNDKITFTVKHLAEIQEILKQNPNKR